MREPHQQQSGRAIRAVAAGTIFASITLVGCGDDAPAADQGKFCARAAAETSMIVAPPMTTAAEVDAALAFYREMGQLAPLSISVEWNQLVAALETASTVVVGDPASEQLVATTAYASERSAYDVKVWLSKHCGVEIPITTIAPQGPLPTPTITAATVPADTPDSGHAGSDSRVQPGPCCSPRVTPSLRGA